MLRICGLLLMILGLVGAELASTRAEVLAAVQADLDEAGVRRYWQVTLERGAKLHDVYAQLEPDGRRLASLVVSATQSGSTWFGTRLSSPAGKLNERLALGSDDWSQVDGQDGHLRGLLALTIGRQTVGREMAQGENGHSMSKSGRKPALNWTIGGRERILPQTADFKLDLTRVAGLRRLTLRLPALAGSARAANPPAADDNSGASWDEIGPLLPKHRAAVDLVIDHDAQGWTPIGATSLSWNRGLHQVTAGDDLELTDDRLRGTLHVHLMPDPWVGGKKGRQLTLTIDATVIGGRVAGQAAVTGDQGAYTVQVAGRSWAVHRGTYQHDGYDGAWSGRAEALVCELASDAAQAIGAAGDDAYAAIAGGLRCRWLPERDPWRVPGREQEVQDLADGADAAAWQAGRVRMAAQAAAAGRPQIGGLDLADTSFGPANDAGVLADNTLPPETGTVGIQRWHRLGAWQTIGPFVGRGRLAAHPPTLPPVVAGVGPYRNERLRLAVTRTVDLAWQTGPVSDGLVRPPQDDWQAIWVHGGKMSSYSSHPRNKAYRAKEAGSRHFVWYGTSTLVVPTAGPVHLAIQAVDTGSLWIDGALVWEAADDHDPWSPLVIRTELTAGSHELMIRCGKKKIGYATTRAAARSGFQLWVCTRGRPRDEAVASTAPALAAGAPIDGWFAPGARRHPDATPPLAWDCDKGINVRWSMKEPGMGQPVLADGLLLVPVEPDGLVAIDRTSGKEQWRQRLNLLALAEGWTGDPADLARFQTEWRQVQAMLRKAEWDKSDARGTPRQDEAIAEYQEAQAMAQQQLQRWNGLAKWLASKGIDLNLRKMKGLGRRSSPPVVTADGIWCRSGTGVVARLGRDGAIVWQRDIGMPDTAGRRGAPVLIGDRLLLGVLLPKKKGEDQMRAVLALDAASGKELWQSDALPGQDLGLTAMNLAGGAVVITGPGDVVAVTDGTVLERELWPFPIGGHEAPMPYVDGDRLWYATRNGQLSLQLSLTADGVLGVRTVWDQRRSGHGGGHGLVHDGLFYVPRVADEFHTHGPVPWDQLDVYGGDHGQHVAKPKPVHRDSLAPMDLVQAGNYLIYSDAGTGTFAIKKRRGQVAMLTVGDEPFVVTRSEWPEHQFITSVPVAADKDLYMVVGGTLWCLAVAGDAGRELEEVARAKAALDRIGLRPRQVSVLAPEPLTAEPAAWRGRSSLVESGIAPSDWLVAGPWSIDGTDPESLLPDGPGAVMTTATGFEQGGTPYTFAPIADQQWTRRGLARVFRSAGTFYRINHSLDVVGLVEKHRSGVLCAAMMYVDQPQVVKYHMRSKGVASWLAGHALTDGQLLRLQPGWYPFLVRIQVTKKPPVGRPLVTPVFLRTQDPVVALRQWKAQIDTLRPRLQRIIDRLPDTAWAIQARTWLEQADGTDQ